MRDSLRLVGRLLRHTLLPAGRGGPRTPRRVLVLVPFLLLYLLLQGVHWIGFLLDELFFPGYRRVRVREPLFVVGLPRSGTSFLQRVLADDRERFTTLRLWELLLAPSVTERTLWLALARLDRGLGRPVGRLVERAGARGFAFMEAVHEVRLDEPEEDYFLLLPVFACFLLVVAWPDHPEVWRLTRFDSWPEAERARILRFYRSCLQRHLYVVGSDRRLLSKNPSFTPMVRSLAETFPDARFVCCVRDPREAVPSLLSSLRAGADRFGWRVEEPAYRDRFVDMARRFGEHALTSLEPGRSVWVPLHRLSEDVEGTVRGVYRHFGWRPGEEMEAALGRRTAASRRHRSAHRYDLAEFDLDPAALERSFEALYRTFDFPTGSAPDPAAAGSPDTRLPGAP